MSSWSSRRSAKDGQKEADGLVVERRFVKLGPVRGERIAVIDGLKEGERVVTSGQVKLQPNSPVTIDETAALPRAGRKAPAVRTSRQ